jgi:hypothetical protein
VIDLNITDVSVNYNSKTGKFDFSLSVGSMPIFGEGAYTVENDTVTLEITSITANAVSLNFKLAVIFKATADAPESRPGELELTEGKIAEVKEDVSKSPLAMMIGSLKS